MPIELFMSYSHADRNLRDELAKHLSGLRNHGIINDWFDGDIIEGTEWKQQLSEHLNTAQIILLLISADFLASNFCYNIEMRRALARHDANEARVIPIILRPTDWKSTVFAELQALPTEGRAVTLWRTRDEAFVNIVNGIKRAIQDLQNSAARPKNAASNILQKQLNHQAPSVIEPVSPTSNVHNQIGSIAGNHHSIVQTGTQHTITNNYYSSSNEKRRTSSSPKKRISGKGKNDVFGR